MQNHLLISFNKYLDQLVSRPGDSDDDIYRKKAYLVGIANLFLFTLLLHILFWEPFRTSGVLIYGIAFLAYQGLQILIFIRIRRGLKWFIYVNNTYATLWAFFTILAMGGITKGGGLYLSGLVCITYAMLHPDRKLVWFSFSIASLSIILLAVLEPFLRTAPLPQWLNLTLFAMNSVWMATTIMVLIFYTFKKEAEVAGLKAQRLEEIDELKTRMFANIAHEFRTPLTLIDGMAELLRTDPDHQRRKRIEAIQRNAGKVLRLVDQMLNLARLEAGSMPLQLIRGDITVFLHHVFQSFPGLAEYRKVRLHFLPENEGYVMDFDPEKLEEVVGNLLTNALKYTPAGGDVYFSFRAISSEPEEFLIKVKDTGIGIPSDKLAYIFDRFYRVEDGQKHYEEGSGIGLTLVREYVKLMGGSIKVKSKTNWETEFTLSLPVTRQAPMRKEMYTGTSNFPLPDMLFDHPGPKELPSIQRPRHPAQLLVIEDNPELSQYLCLILGSKFQLLTAGNGEEGIRLAIEQVPDLILSDVMMPVKDGFELCRTLKKDFRTCHIPIVLLTARADKASRILGLEHGADAYLTKPFNQRELLACLRNLFLQREKLRIKYGAHAEQKAESSLNPGMDEIFLSKVRSILEENYQDETFQIKTLYTALGISRVQLHRKLIALTGQSSSQFIRRFRLEKARTLLFQTLKSVSEIAFETGFTDPNYFSRAFSQEYGRSPSSFRKEQVKAG